MFLCDRAPRAVALAAAVVVGYSTTVGAGPWSELPEAVSRLQQRPADPAAAAVLAAAEASVVAEADAGRVAAVAALVDVYGALVSPLEGGGELLERLERRLAERLVLWAEGHAALGAVAVGRAWTLAAELAGDERALAALRRRLLPPADARPGAVWRSPIDGAELVLQPALRYYMGCTEGDRSCLRNEKTSRWVEVPAFWLDRTEVVNARYRRCVEAGVCTPPDDPTGAYADPARAREPVVAVSWRQAATYAAWAGRRLPSESEWERAARGKTPALRYVWGPAPDRGAANLVGTGGGDGFRGLAPAGSFPATGWGVFDLAGNVWEWCADSYHQNLIAAPRDGSPRADGARGRVLRGGSWRRGLDFARVSSRSWELPDYAARDVGFRCALEAGEGPDDAVVVALAGRVFTNAGGIDAALAEAHLDLVDRRYLERRAVTWLVLEGRVAEALPEAATLISRRPDDPFGNELFLRIELQLVVEAREGDLDEIRRALAGYRRAVSGSQRLAARMAGLNRRLIDELRASVERLERSGARAEALRRLELALSLAPGDRRLTEMLPVLSPAAGSERRWPGDGKTMVWIPAGGFEMGAAPGDRSPDPDELPRHTVAIAGFWLDRTEVTNREYRRCVEAGACDPPHRTVAFDDPTRADVPVLWVDWFEARDYARWAGKRLPTEAEWEYAARAGADRVYPWGDGWRDGLANAFSERGEDRFSDAAPVASFPTNAWGLADMLGNVWEWVEDGYHPGYVGAPSSGRAWRAPVGGVGIGERVLRGGGYLSSSEKLRLSERHHRAPGAESRTFGFRCAADG